jgi:hypothetical protein
LAPLSDGRRFFSLKKESPMSKHGNGYERVERDLYPTDDPRPIAALGEYFNFVRREIWEIAAGRGHMVKAILREGAAQVFATDIVQRDFPLDRTYDFIGGEPAPTSIPVMITNPPLGQRGKLAEAFIDAGLPRIGRRGMLALLLPCDFDSAVTRRKYFAECPLFAAKIVLTPGRIVWFKRTDGEREAPMENSAWYVWKRRYMRTRVGPPELHYACGNEGG